MSEPKINPSEIVARLESNPPEVYVKLLVPTKDKNGEIKEKRYNMDTRTGDVFKNRKLAFEEAPNFSILRAFGYYANGQQSVERIAHPAYQKAYVVEEGVVVATWVFCDYVNNENTSVVPYSYGACRIEPVEGTKQNESAVINFVISKPKIAAIALVTRSKEVYYWEDVEHYGMLEANEYFSENRCLAPSLYSALHNASCAKTVVNLKESFKDFFGIGYVGANEYTTFDYFSDVSLFMRASVLKPRNGPKQALVDQLCSVELPDHSNEEISEIDCENFTICYADRINEEWVALRWFVPIAGRRIETSRMLVNKKDVVLCRNNLHGRWVYAPQKIRPTTFRAEKVVMQNPDVFNNTKVEYFKQIATDSPNQSAALYMLTVFPEFEKMYKMGLDWLCESYLQDIYQSSWRNYVEGRCGTIDWKAKSMFKMLGINHHQIETINKHVKTLQSTDTARWQRHYVSNIIGTLKNIFITDELNNIDNDTFDFIVSTFTSHERLGYHYSNALSRTYDLYGKDAIYFIKDLNKVSDGNQVITVNSHGGTREMNADIVYSDMMRMIQAGNYTDQIRPRFSSLEQLVQCHDILVDLTNAEEVNRARYSAERWAEGFKARKDKWLEYEWDEDETFCVIAPKEPVDIAVEGITLHHCVKSFIPAVSVGETNIVFIRKKGNEKEPFFTVEIDNRKSIRQVHGNCNSNVSSVSGLKEFITKWAKAKKLKYVAGHANRIAGAGY